MAEIFANSWSTKVESALVDMFDQFRDHYNQDIHILDPDPNASLARILLRNLLLEH